ncbi:MAG: hypothetical protein ABSG18_26490 [Steroidobacteraceae bacterium]
MPLAVDELLDDAEETLRAWADEAERAYHEGRDIAGALAARFAEDLSGVEPEARERVETLNGIHSNADGFRRWLDQRHKPAAADGPPA